MDRDFGSAMPRAVMGSDIPANRPFYLKVHGHMGRTLGNVRVCPNCGEENPEKFRLCGYCGTKLVPDKAPQAARKLVTIVFCDLAGSTSMGETLDSESRGAPM